MGAQSDGKARIMNEADPVRVELETALRRDLNVLPVLLDGASMPDPGDLPESIRDFAYRNAVEVESGRDFNVHIDRLIRAIEQLLGVKAKVEPPPVSPLLSQAPPATRKTRPKLWATALLGVGALAVAGLLWFGGIPWPTDKEDAPEGLPPFCLELGKVLFHAEPSSPRYSVRNAAVSGPRAFSFLDGTTVQSGTGPLRGRRPATTVASSRPTRI